MRTERCSVKGEAGEAESGQVTDGTERHAREFGLYRESARKPQNNLWH